MHDQFKTGCGAEFRTLEPVASITKKSLMYQQKGGCRVQNSGPWDPWLPVVENSRLFAQRTVRPPKGLPNSAPLVRDRHTIFHDRHMTSARCVINGATSTTGWGSR